MCIWTMAVRGPRTRGISWGSESGAAFGRDLDDVDILSALKGFSYRDFTGRTICALATTDRRTVYAEDFYGDGSWWEVGSVKGRVPVYGLKLREDAA